AVPDPHPLFGGLDRLSAHLDRRRFARADHRHRPLPGKRVLDSGGDLCRPRLPDQRRNRPDGAGDQGRRAGFDPLNLMLARFLALMALLGLAACGGPERGEGERREPAAATRGLDAATMDRTVEAARQLPRLRALIVLRHGETLAEHRFNDGPPLDQPVNVKSASKSILSALIGIAIDKGVLEGVDQPLLSVLRDDAPPNPDPRLRQVTVDHLLSMR